MNFARGVLIALVVVWLQLALLPLIGPWGVVPNLALVAVIVLAARVPAVTSLWLAATMGWLLDIGSGSDYGLRTGFYILMGLVTVALGRWGSDLDNFSLLASLVAGATVLLNLAILTNLAIQHLPIPPKYVAIHILTEVILNLILLYPARWLLSRILTRPAGDIVIGLAGRRG